MKKSIIDWEKIQGKVIVDVSKIDLQKKVTLDEFTKIADENIYYATDYEFREKWLTDNGYEINRENLLNADLTPKV